MAGNNAIQILRGNGQAISNAIMAGDNSPILLDGQPFYNTDKNYLTIGKSVNSLPIRTRELVGYVGDIAAIGGCTIEAVSIKPNIGAHNVQLNYSVGSSGITGAHSFQIDGYEKLMISNSSINLNATTVNVSTALNIGNGIRLTSSTISSTACVTMCAVSYANIQACIGSNIAVGNNYIYLTNNSGISIQASPLKITLPSGPMGYMRIANTAGHETMIGGGNITTGGIMLSRVASNALSDLTIYADEGLILNGNQSLRLSQADSYIDLENGDLLFAIDNSVTFQTNISGISSGIGRAAITTTLGGIKVCDTGSTATDYALYGGSQIRYRPSSTNYTLNFPSVSGNLVVDNELNAWHLVQATLSEGTSNLSTFTVLLPYYATTNINNFTTLGLAMGQFNTGASFALYPLITGVYQNNATTSTRYPIVGFGVNGVGAGIQIRMYYRTSISSNPTYFQYDINSDAINIIDFYKIRLV